MKSKYSKVGRVALNFAAEKPIKSIAAKARLLGTRAAQEEVIARHKEGLNAVVPHFNKVFYTLVRRSFGVTVTKKLGECISIIDSEAGHFVREKPTMLPAPAYSPNPRVQEILGTIEPKQLSMILGELSVEVKAMRTEANKFMTSSHRHNAADNESWIHYYGKSMVASAMFFNLLCENIKTSLESRK